MGEESGRDKRPKLSGPRSLAVVALCTLVGLALRIAFAGRSGIWCDEAQFIAVVRLPSLRSMIDFLRYQESHPPFFYLLMRGWLGIFGDTEAAALALPVLLGTALVPVVYWVGSRMYSQPAGLIAAALVATSPPLARFSGMVRPYSFLPLLCLLSVYWLWRGMTERGLRPWLFHVTATVTMLLTHNWSWMVVGAEWIAVVVWLVWQHEWNNSALLRSWSLAQGLVLLAYAPWLPAFLHQSQHAGYGPRPLHPLLVVGHFAETAMSLPVQAAIPVSATLVGAAAAFALLGRAPMPPQSGDRLLGAVLVVGVPLFAYIIALLCSLRQLILFSHCLATVVPCVLLAIACAIACWSSMPRCVTLVMASIFLAFSVRLCGEPKSNVRELAAAVAASSRPSDMIVISPAWFVSSFNYYYKLPNPQSNYPHEERRGAIDYVDLRKRLLDPTLIAKTRSRLAQAHREGRRIWFITLPQILSASVPEGDTLLESDKLPTYTHVGNLRTNQIHHHIEQLYGPPNRVIVSDEGRRAAESFHAELYELILSPALEGSYDVVDGPEESKTK